MNLKLTLLLILAAAISFGCNTVGEPVEFAKACDAENDKKTIEVTGILEDKKGVFCSNTSGRYECGFNLVQTAGDDKGLSSDIEVGTWANNVEKIEGSYKRADIKIRDNNSEFVKLGDKVKLTGKLTTAPDPTSPTGGVCYMQVYKIER